MRGRGRPPAGSRPVLSDEALLDRALEMFAERGFEGASVRELARELHVSHNLIPQRYGSKERLWYAAVDRGFGDLLVRLQGLMEDLSPHGPLEQMRAVTVEFLEASVLRPEVLRIITHEAVAPGPRLDHLVDRYVRPVADWYDVALTQARDEGRVRNVDIALMYFLIVHGGAGAIALPALARRFGDGVDVHDPAAVRAYAHHVTDAVFDGLVRGERIPGQRGGS